MINIIRWTLWQRRWNTLTWSLGAVGLTLINIIFYPSFKDQAAELTKSFENLPDAAIQFLGGSTDFFSPVGFLNSQIFFIMLPLIYGIYAISLGSNLIGREERDRTIELLLSRPISRSKLLFAKATSGVAMLFIVSFIGALSIMIGSAAVGIEIGLFRVVAAIVACFSLSLSFGAIAFFFTATGKAKSLAVGVTSVVAIGGYLVSSLSGTVSWLETPSRFFPFYYYQSEKILSGTYNFLNLSYFIFVIFLTGVFSWMIFRNRDIA